MSQTNYRADIDGLRCLAVMPVVLYHAGVTGLSGGFVGVDIFFVISGFLITGILQQDLIDGSFSIARFYERRIRRILPALAFTLVLTTLAALWLFLPSYLADYGRSLLSTATFTSNLYFWKFSGYFESSAQLRPLLHTWSLAVEEQFYIVVPLVLWALWKLSPRAALPASLLGLLASLALSLYATGVAPTANFFLLPTRAWELLAGSALALYLLRPVRRRRRSSRRRSLPAEALALAGVALMVVPMVAYSDSTPFPGLAAVPPCLGAVLVILTGARRATLVSRALSLRPVVFIGLISYSLYLVHWPVTVFVRYATLSEPDPATVAAIVAVSLALAAFSWRFVERPFRQPGFRPPRPLLFGATAAILAVLALGGAGLNAGHGLPQRFADLERLKPAGSGGKTWNQGSCFFQDDYAFEAWTPEACRLTDNPGPRVLLWGDSYAAHYVPGLRANAADIAGTVYQYSAAGCPPVLSYVSQARPRCHAFSANALALIDRLGITEVVLAARWVDLRSRGVDTLAPTIRTLRDRGLKVTVIGQSPMFVTDVPVIAYAKADAGGAAEDRWPTIIDPDLNRALAAASRGATFVDPVAALCAADGCAYRIGGRFVYYDAGHFTDFGSALAVRAYFPGVGARTSSAAP